MSTSGIRLFLEFKFYRSQVKAERTPCGEADYQILGKFLINLNLFF